MTSAVKQQFDSDYRYVRLEMLKGNMPLSTAKLWLQARGKKTIDQMHIDLHKNDEKFWRARAARELEQFQGCDGEDDE